MISKCRLRCAFTDVTSRRDAYIFWTWLIIRLSHAKDTNGRCKQTRGTGMFDVQIVKLKLTASFNRPNFLECCHQRTLLFSSFSAEAMVSLDIQSIHSLDTRLGPSRAELDTTYISQC